MIHSTRLILSAALLLALSGSASHAVTFNWNTSVSSGTWMTNANWLEQPGNTASVGTPWTDTNNIFNLTTGSGTVTAQLNNTTAFDARLNVQTGGRLQLTTVATTVTVNNLHLDGGKIFKSSSASPLIVAGAVAVDSNSILEVDGSGGTPAAFVISAPISGAGQLEVINGTSGSFLRIAGDNNAFSGGWLVTAGGLLFDTSANAVGGSSSKVAVASGGSVQVSGVLTIANEIKINTGGTYLLPGNTSTTTLNNLILNGGRLNKNSSSTAVLAGNLSVAANSSFEVASGSAGYTISSLISGSSQIEITNNATATITVNGDNSGYTGTWLLTKGTLAFGTSNNAIGGTGAKVTVNNGGILQVSGITVGNEITVNAGGTYLMSSANSATVNNLILNGGKIRKTTSGINTLTGNISVTANSQVEVPSGASNSFNLNANFSGSSQMEVLNSTTTAMNIGGVNSSFSGGWLLTAGPVSLATPETFSGSGIYTSYAMGTGKFNTTAAAGNATISGSSTKTSYVLQNVNVGGTGKLLLGDSSTAAGRTLTLRGSIVDPGVGIGTAGIFTVERTTTDNANIVLAINPDDANKASTLVIDVVGTGGIAGTHYDQFVLTKGNLSGLAASKLTVNFANALNVNDLNILSPNITIVSLGNGTISGTFDPGNITFTGGIQAGTITYNSNSIVLSNFQAVPEPSTWALLALGGMALAGRRLRGRRAK